MDDACQITQKQKRKRKNIFSGITNRIVISNIIIIIIIIINM